MCSGALFRGTEQTSEGALRRAVRYLQLLPKAQPGSHRTPKGRNSRAAPAPLERRGTRSAARAEETTPDARCEGDPEPAGHGRETMSAAKTPCAWGRPSKRHGHPQRPPSHSASALAINRANRLRRFTRTGLISPLIKGSLALRGTVPAGPAQAVGARREGGPSPPPHLTDMKSEARVTRAKQDQMNTRSRTQRLTRNAALPQGGTESPLPSR